MTKPLISEDHLTAETNETPRRKCCEQCAFLPSDPQNIQGTPEWAEWVADCESGWGVFYCTHTKDEQGRNQVCAGFHAKYGRHQS